MNKNTTPPETLSMGTRDVLTDYLHQGACEMLTTAKRDLEAGVGRLVQTVTCRQTVCLSLGRRRLFQCSPGRPE